MEQRDYILREIEKIGTIMRAIWQKIFGGKEKQAVILEKQVNEVKALLLDKLNFDLDNFLMMNMEETDKYLNQLRGFDVENTELLAESIAEIGYKFRSENSLIYLEKALQLYDLINIKSQTYSFDRQAKIQSLRNYLESNMTKDE